MRRFLLASLIGVLIGQLAFAAGTEVKSYIGAQDLNLDLDGAAHGTFLRRSSTGGTITLDRIDGNQIPWSLDYSRTIRPKGITGNSTGAIQGYSFGSASYTDNGYFRDIKARGPWVDVRAYGAVTLGTGVSAAQKTANAATIKATIDSVTGTDSPLTSGGQEIRLPPGDIYIDGDVVKLNKGGIRLVGMGPRATKLHIDSGVAITVSKDTAAVLYQTEVSNLGIVGHGATNKVGIRAVDSSGLIIHNVEVNTLEGNTSIGLQIRGRELGTVSNSVFYADRPISIENNPNIEIDFDTWNLHNVYTSAFDNTQGNIFIDNGVSLLNTTFDGYNIWTNGKYGLYWNDSSAVTSAVLSISGARWEQAAASTGAAIYIAHTSTGRLEGLYISNTVFSTPYDAIDLKGVTNVDMSTVNVNQTGAGYDAFLSDNTVFPVTMRNFLYQAGSFTVGASPVAEKFKLLNNDVGIVFGLWDADTVNRGVQIGGGTKTQMMMWGNEQNASDNTTIAHGLGVAPGAVWVTGTVAGEIVNVSSWGTTTFTIRVLKHDGSAGTTQPILWMAVK
jgi:hypothetical protein